MKFDQRPPSLVERTPRTASGQKRDRPGIYIHVPFCRRICPYCDFAVVRDNAQRRSEFAAHLVKEIEGAEWTGPEGFDTVYFGGGTPSVLSVDDLEEILNALHRRFDCSPDLRVFLEANPEDVNLGTLSEWCDLGVEFLSLGVQALSADRLRFLGREHDVDAAVGCIEEALASGISMVSVDLIYGHIGQSLNDWAAELERMAELGLRHLSCYSLTVEPKTSFGLRAKSGEHLLPAQDLQSEFFCTTHELLAEFGLPGYEVSNFAGSELERSGHNTKYWRAVPYLGLGPSAHSFDGESRWWNLRHERAWARKLTTGDSPIDGREVLTAEQRLLETVLLGLRTVEGIDLSQIRKEFERDFRAEKAAYLEGMVSDGLARQDRSQLSLTLSGWAVADRIVADLCC